MTMGVASPSLPQSLGVFQVGCSGPSEFYAQTYWWQIPAYPATQGTKPIRYAQVEFGPTPEAAVAALREATGLCLP